MDETRRDIADARISHLKREFDRMVPQWRDLRDNFMPTRGRFNKEDDASIRKQRLANNTPVLAVRTAGSGLHAGLTSPARPWQKSAIEDKDLMDWAPVREWLAIVDSRMLGYYAKSNLYQALPTMYSEYAAVGTMCALCLENDDTLFRFEPYTVGHYMLARSETGVYDTFAREFTMTVRQMHDRFGYQALSKKTRGKYDNHKTREEKVDIHHLVEPDGRGAFDSCYYETGAKHESNKGLLKRARFTENPILAASWETVWGESYASNCPGMSSLGDARALQREEINKARAIDRHHNPAMQGPATLKMQGVSLAPGAMNWVDQMQATGQMGQIRPVHDFKPEIGGLLDNIQKNEARINSGFFVDLFLMLTMDDRNQRATAEEIRARYDEKVLVLGPTLEQANAMLRTLHSRAFGIMLRKSQPIWEGRIDGDPILPPPPKELEGLDIVPEFISALQQAQRAQQLQGIERFAGFAAQISQYEGRPSAKLDTDQALDIYAAALGIDPTIIRDDDEVSEIRQGEAQAAQMEKMAAMAPAIRDMGAGAKSLSEATAEPDSLLGSMAGVLPG